jgi:hypothetical protein
LEDSNHTAYKAAGRKRSAEPVCAGVNGEWAATLDPWNERSDAV